MLEFSSKDLMNGIILALICYGGLTLGVTLLFKAKTKGRFSGLYSLSGALCLCAQFLLAAYFVYIVTPEMRDPVSFAVGLVVTLFSASLLTRLYQKTA